MFVLILLELTTVTFKVFIVEFSLQSNRYMDILSSVSFSSTLLTFFFFSVQELWLVTDFKSILAADIRM
jgi:hypothetical protein